MRARCDLRDQGYPARKERSASHAEGGRVNRFELELEQFASIAVSRSPRSRCGWLPVTCMLLSRRYKGKLDSDADEFIAFARGRRDAMHA